MSKNTPQAQFVHLYSLEGLMPFLFSNREVKQRKEVNNALFLDNKPVLSQCCLSHIYQDNNKLKLSLILTSITPFPAFVTGKNANNKNIIKMTLNCEISLRYKLSLYGYIRITQIKCITLEPGPGLAKNVTHISSSQRSC